MPAPPRAAPPLAFQRQASAAEPFRSAPPVSSKELAPRAAKTTLRKGQPRERRIPVLPQLPRARAPAGLFVFPLRQALRARPQLPAAGRPVGGVVSPSARLLPGGGALVRPRRFLPLVGRDGAIPR